jgi:hypothetical protein
VDNEIWSIFQIQKTDLYFHTTQASSTKQIQIQKSYSLTTLLSTEEEEQGEEWLRFLPAVFLALLLGLDWLPFLLIPPWVAFFLAPLPLWVASLLVWAIFPATSAASTAKLGEVSTTLWNIQPKRREQKSSKA